MGFNKVLLPLDGSELAELAIRRAIEVANAGARIHLLSVVDPNCFDDMAVRELAGLNTTDFDELDRLLEAATEVSDREGADVYLRQRYLMQRAEQLIGQGFKATVKIVAGYAATSISAAACDGFDVIVMATHGRSGLTKVFLGSVTQEILHNLPCPILIVPANIPQPSSRKHA